MPKVSRESAAHVEDHGPVEERREDVDGTTIQFLTFRQEIDATPFMRGLPDDMCQCPHWGYVTKGRISFRFADHVEVFEAGDAFSIPPGHVPSADADSEYVSFSPSAELQVVTDVMTKNMQAMQNA